MALVYFAFFAFNKQAFCNDYYLVLGALCAAVATANAPSTPGDAAEGDDGAGPGGA